MEINGLNYYEFLQIRQDASVAEIKKAYRIKALELHPDKNLDDPNAKENFEKLADILKILAEPNSRNDYDHKLKVKKEKIIRDAELDSRRRKFKEDLEERERRFNEEKERKNVQDLEKLRETERVRCRNMDLLNEENKKIKTKVEKDLFDLVNRSTNPAVETLFRMRIEWDCKVSDSSKSSIHNIFSQYGDSKITDYDKKNNSAYVEYADRRSVILALNAKLDNFVIRTVEVAIKNLNNKQSNNSPFGIKPGQSFHDFEKEVLDKMNMVHNYQSMARNRGSY